MTRKPAPPRRPRAATPEGLGINLDALGVVGTPKRSKYRNVPTVYEGVRYASKAEARRAEELDIQRLAGEIRLWIGQPKFRLGCPENVYVPDFFVVDREGWHAEDVKGSETAKFRRDRRLWAKYGPCDLWVIRGRGVEVIKGGLTP
jgi:hypothetical protein